MSLQNHYHLGCFFTHCNGETVIGISVQGRLVIHLTEFRASFIFHYWIPAYEEPGKVPVNEGEIGYSKRGSTGY